MKKIFAFFVFVIFLFGASYASGYSSGKSGYSSGGSGYSSRGSGYSSGGSGYSSGNSKRSSKNSDTDFYDEILDQMFSSMEEGLVSKGFDSAMVKRNLSLMRARVNKSELEQMTLSCMNKYDDIKANRDQIANECFTGWITKFIMVDSADIIQKMEQSSPALEY